MRSRGKAKNGPSIEFQVFVLVFAFHFQQLTGDSDCTGNFSPNADQM